MPPSLLYGPKARLLTAIRISDRSLEADRGRFVRHVDAYQRAEFSLPPCLEKGNRTVVEPSLHGGRIPFSDERQVEHLALLCREDLFGSPWGRGRGTDDRKHATERCWDQKRAATVGKETAHTEGYRKTRWPETCERSSSTRRLVELKGSMQRMVSSQYPLSLR